MLTSPQHKQKEVKVELVMKVTTLINEDITLAVSDMEGAGMLLIHLKLLLITED